MGENSGWEVVKEEGGGERSCLSVILKKKTFLKEERRGEITSNLLGKEIGQQLVPACCHSIHVEFHPQHTGAHLRSITMYLHLVLCSICPVSVHAIY